MPDARISVRPANSNKRTAAPGAHWRRLRLIPLAVGALAMAAGLWTGLARLGVSLPGGVPSMTEFHAAFMIAGFLGTMISLERAVALGRPWGYMAPVLSSVGALLLFASVLGAAALTFIAASGILLLATSIGARRLSLFAVILAAGAICWAIGTSLWLIGFSMPVVVGWWLDFLILTIAAERLELSRFGSPPRMSSVMLTIAVLLLLIGSARGELASDWAPFTTVGLLACAAWLLRFDIARRTIRGQGQPRFSACAILAGQMWLGVAGALLLFVPPGVAAFSYDAAVHAIAIGFVLSMIFAHAPIILPAIIGARVGYSGAVYAPLILLHFSVLLRVASDLFEWSDLRSASGIFTVLALLGYAITIAVASRRPNPTT